MKLYFCCEKNDWQNFIWVSQRIPISDPASLHKEIWFSPSCSASTTDLPGRIAAAWCHQPFFTHHIISPHCQQPAGHAFIFTTLSGSKLLYELLYKYNKAKSGKVLLIECKLGLSQTTTLILHGKTLNGQQTEKKNNYKRMHADI